MSGIAEDTGLPWYALKVRTRGETAVSDALRSKGFQVFLPTYLECRPYSDRIKKFHAALFPGYLFCRLNPTAYLPVLKTSGVEQVVNTAGTPTPIAETEILSLQTIQRAQVPVVPWPYLKTGHRIRIQFGALAGLEGIVLRLRGAEHLVLSVDLLQRSIRVEIDRSWVVPCSWKRDPSNTLELV